MKQRPRRLSQLSLCCRATVNPLKNKGCHCFRLLEAERRPWDPSYQTAVGDRSGQNGRSWTKNATEKLAGSTYTARMCYLGHLH